MKETSISVHFLCANNCKKEIKDFGPHLTASLRHAVRSLGRLACGLGHPWFLRKPSGISHHFSGSQVTSEALRYPGQLGALWFSMRSLDTSVSLHLTLERSLGFWHALVPRQRNNCSRLVHRNDGPSVRHFVRQVGSIFHIHHSRPITKLVNAPRLSLRFWLLKFWTRSLKTLIQRISFIYWVKTVSSEQAVSFFGSEVDFHVLTKFPFHRSYPLESLKSTIVFLLSVIA